MKDEIKEVLDCYDLKELKKLKKKYGTVKVNMNYNVDKISAKDWKDIDYAIFYQTLVLTLFKKEIKYNCFFGKEIAILPDWYDGILRHTADKLTEKAIIEWKNGAMNISFWELKFWHKIKSMRQIRIYT